MSNCTLTESDVRCTDQGAYRVYAADCHFCHHHSFLFCVGHWMCIRHSAGMRSGLYQWGGQFDGLGDVDAEMVTS